MTQEEFNKLDVGDVVYHKDDKRVGYVVTCNYGNHVTAVRTADLTAPGEWDIHVKVTQREFPQI